MVFGLILKLIPTYGNITRLAALLIGLVLPTFKSFEAIESRAQDDDKQWLTYWVCYTTLTSLEAVAWGFLIWIPFYRILRVVLLAWLALPQFEGAAVVYEEFVRPFLLVAVAKAKEIPSLEPYVTRFAATGKDYDSLKREVVAKTEAEKAKQQAESTTVVEDDTPSYMKAHAQ